MMNSSPAIAIFDIGKTNKKMFVFNEQYQILLERSVRFEEVTDEDGDACENLEALTVWIRQLIDELMQLEGIVIKAINFSTYGASFVHLNREGKPVAPLYNYLKPFPEDLKNKFYENYGGETNFSIETASPVLGNLNSGLQLYYLKEKKLALFNKIHASLHLPQYLSYLVTGRLYSDVTSIGCHTALWNFTRDHYHEWLQREGIISKLSPIFPSDQPITTNWKGKPLLCGVGLHDSSAALIPYLAGFKQPFVLISTGTWCISLNPFNQAALTAEELQQDCLCYMEYRGKPVKAARLFAGYEHEQQVKRLSTHFNLPLDHFTTIAFDPVLAGKIVGNKTTSVNSLMQDTAFAKNDLSCFTDYKSAYHQLMGDIVMQQVLSASLIMQDNKVEKIFVDGGFGRNTIYMHLLARAFPGKQVYAASVAQASAIGAALAIHAYWNKNNIAEGLIELKHYADIEAIEI